MRIIYNSTTKEVVQIVEDDSSITSFPEGLAVIQDAEENVMVMAQALGLHFPTPPEEPLNEQ